MKPFSRDLRSALPLVFGMLILLGFGATLQAWEGHDWNQWQRVTTWKKPELRTDQAGRRDLAPLLDSGATATVAGWEAKRQRIHAIIQSILGQPTDLKAPRPEIRELDNKLMPGYTRRHVRIRTEADDWIPAYLLVPNDLHGRRAPAMICLHQTVAQGKEEPCGIQGDPELAFAVELVNRGYVCIAPDAIGFGERIAPGKQPYDNSLAFYRRHPGWSFMGKMIWDVGRVVDYLESLPMVDAKKIGAIGHSHGAYGSLFAAAFEPRLAAAVASCGFTTFRADPRPQRWSHLTALMPQLGCYLPDVSAIPFDWQHVLALAAPRRLYVWYTTDDSVFPHTENLDGLLRDVQRVYRLYGAREALAWRSSAGPHRFPRAEREAAYCWLDETLAERPSAAKTASAFFPADLVARARCNAREHAWAAEIRDSLVAAAKPWKEMSDDQLWGLMFGNTLKRAWQVWSNGYCPACKKPVPMYEWVPDALHQPWKMCCPQCRELFPKNDFAKFYRSGLNEQNVFDPKRADRSLLFNVEHPAPSDPLHLLGVDDGEGYVEGGHRWRFINAYLIFGQWKQAIVAGVRNLAAAYVSTGDPVYAHKAAVLLDRVADLYPTFDFGKEGVMYEGPPRAGYVSTWHDACAEVHDMALAYDAIFEGLAGDRDLVRFLAAKAAAHKLPNPKSSVADIRRNIETRIFHDTLAHRAKIESNYPATDAAVVTLRTVLHWPRNRADVMAMLDAIISKATAVDGLTGEKGLAGYATIGPHNVAELLGRYARSDPDFIGEAVRRHPRLHAMYRFHVDTLCLGDYYPRSGDTGAFGMKGARYAALTFSQNPGIFPSAYSFLGAMHQATGDKDFIRVLYRANGNSSKGLPYDLFTADPAGFQATVAKTIAEDGAEIKLRSVNKTEWGLAILRSGEGRNARAAWLDYDSGGGHGHADAMTIGLFARGLDLLPDFGYPPVQFGGWSSPRAVWYTQTAAHNTISVDGQNTRPGVGKTTLWCDGAQLHAIRASAPKLINGRQFERTLLLVDTSDKDFYVLDVFRAAGGTEHTRFLHGYFGNLTTQGLRPAPVKATRYGTVMRNFRRDAKPTEGWSADWKINDRLKYLSPPSDLHLRYTDLTRGAEVELAEAWVATTLYGGTADAWIPSVLARRRAEQAPLASAFVGVLEPYEGAAKIAAIKRFELQDSQGRACADSDVAVDVRLGDGRRDIFVSRNVEIARAAGELRRAANGLDLRFDGDLCLVRYNAAGQPERVLFCRGKSLHAGTLDIRAKDEHASFEIDLTNHAAPVVTGPAETVGQIESSGVRLWPK